MSDLLPVTQADRDAVQAFHRTMAARLMSDIASERPTLGKDEGDAGTLVQAFARHRLAALDSRAGDAGEGLVLPPGWKPWTGGPFTPQDYAGRYMLRNRSFHDWRPGNGAGPSWKWEYGEGDIVAYLATPAPAVDAVPAGEVEPCSFADCPPGLVRWNGVLCFKSEYSTKAGQPDAYCVDGGEYFWGGTSGDLEKRRNLMVQPVASAALSHGEGRK